MDPTTASITEAAVGVELATLRISLELSDTVGFSLLASHFGYRWKRVEWKKSGSEEDERRGQCIYSKSKSGARLSVAGCEKVRQKQVSSCYVSV